MKLTPIILWLTLLTGCTNSSSTTPQVTNSSWSHENVLTFDELNRKYSIYIPTENEIQGLVLVLHGSGETVEQHISNIQVEATAEENGLIVVVPAGINNGWNDEDPPNGELADDVGFIDALVTELKTAYPNLPNDKIFAHGFSNGGGLATRLACESTQIRGISVIGNYYVSISDTCTRPSERPIPGWFGAGLEDDLVPIEMVRESILNYATDLTDCQSAGVLETVNVPDLPINVSCKQLSGCDSARLCEYAHRGHEVLPNTISTAWYFLQEAVQTISE